MAWASSAEEPCSIISRANVSPPTTITPRATIATASAVVPIAARAIRVPIPRAQAGPERRPIVIA